MEIENIVTRTLSTLLPRLFTESPLGILEAGVCPHAAAPAVTGPGLWLVMHQSPGPRPSIICTSVTLSSPAGTRNIITSHSSRQTLAKY